jgi:hypothetical protein
MSALHSGVQMASPLETNLLAAGEYTFAIKAVDTSGNESVNALYINATLGDPRLDGAISILKDFADGWPGTKTNCHVDLPSGFLQPNETDVTPWTGTWAGRSWIKAPETSITYERLTDVDVVAVFTPLVSVSGDGTITTTEAHSDDGVAYTEFVAAGTPITARYIKVRIVAAGAWPILREVTTILSAKPIYQDTEDLATAGLTGAYRIGVGDIRVPLTETFSAIRKVDLTLQNVGAGWSWELIDKDTVTGPRIKIYNSLNTAADATIDVTVRGL